MQRATQRWSTQVDLWFIFLAVALWYCWPQARGIPLILLILAFIVRRLQHRFIIERTAFELPLAIFLLTAFAGVWAAYNHQDAWAKFWSILGAVAIFYGLASQPKERLWVIAELLSMIAILVAATFLLSSPAPTQAADLPIIERIQSWLNNIHLFGYLSTGQPNQAGGILAMLLPFSIARGIHALQNRRRAAIWFSFATGSFILIGLFITSSRGAWFALAIGMGVWLTWGLSDTLARRWQAAQSRIFVMVVLTASMAAVIFLSVVLAGGVPSLVQHLPGLHDFGNRIHIFQNTLLLIDDFPITGGGLAAFAGLYSQYILSIPYFMFAYSHNLYLDVALEQGVFGFIAFLATLLICAGLLWHHISTDTHILDQNERMPGRSGDQVSLLSQAALVGLMVITLHGFLDDPFYNTQGAPLLFVFGGLASAITKASFEGKEHAEITTSDIWLSQGSKLLNYWGMAILPVILLVVLVYDFRDRWLSTWYADSGALQMARLELAGFPTYKWDDNEEAAKMTNVIKDFNISLSYDPNNLTSHYRLGLIAMLQHNFPEAASELEISLRLSSNHPGIRKNLGYSLVWMARYNQAYLLLQDIPEARDELETYVWWWQNQGRKDLAGRAGQMARLLEGKGQISPETIYKTNP